jgi:hypothetical protein
MEDNETIDPQLKKIKNAAGILYDLQKLRIQSGNRSSSLKVDLDEKDVAFLKSLSSGLDLVENTAERELKRHLKGYPIFEQWLTHQSGVGTKMSGVMISSIDIHKCETVSQLWAYAGLAVVDGHSQRRMKGQKANYNTWLRAKLVKVLGDNLIRFSKLDESGVYMRSTAKEPTPIPKEQAWRRFYDNYKTRKQNTILPVCMGCEGTGKVTIKPKGQFWEDDADKATEPVKKAKPGVCSNCEGTGGPAPWGKSDGHRHNAARRYMVKMFLQELWLQWRTIEGLSVNVPYAEAYLDMKHGDHKGSNIGPQASAEVPNAAE